jgi:hypothetical protein
LPEIGTSERKLKTRRQHTNYNVAFTVKGKGLAHDVRVSTKPALPQAIGQNGNARCALLVFAGLKRASKERFDAEQEEEIS